MHVKHCVMHDQHCVMHDKHNRITVSNADSSKGFKTKKEANKMRDEELILIGMKVASPSNQSCKPLLIFISNTINLY